MSLTISKEIKLLPCPFCGGAADLNTGVIREVKTFDVVCRDCGGAMMASNEDDVIADWNTRPADVGTGKVT